MSNRRIQKSSSQRSAGVQMHVAQWSLAAALVTSLCLTASIAVGDTVNPFDAPETSASESVDARGVVDSLRQNDLAAAQEGANKLIKSDPKNPWVTTCSAAFRRVAGTTLRPARASSRRWRSTAITARRA